VAPASPGARLTPVAKQDGSAVPAATWIGPMRAAPRCRLSSKGPAVTYVITFACVDVKDKSCIEECPVDCIYEGDRMLYIQPDECVDCGACEPVCPVEAIYYEDDVPEEWSDYTAANAEFFADLGSPGGAAKLGAQEFDAALLASVPRKESES
jgi:NAD-dependent dihydropyrimidine dehydrogenase PreA subunit